MARRSRSTTPQPPEPEDFEEHITDIDVSDEMRTSYLEYAYSVIYQRAVPDARDGLKPVQRRILYQMNEMGLRPDRGYVKCARVVGEVMGRLHPHGDSAIYDALVRMAQSWAMRLPLVDGHGNFGSLGGDDAPAAMRYTEARLAPPAMEMVASIGEDTVDFIPNYDGQEQQPDVLPAAFPNLLVNGASGIAVGMATNMAPHNLGEVIAAARHLISHPDATLADLMRFVPGPDLPTGGKIVGLGGIRDAYATGRGSFRTRATTRIEKVNTRRTGIVITELPYGVGPERVISRIKALVQAKKLAGISDLKDLTDRQSGLRLVIEIRSGFNPDAVLAELYRLTPMEETFGINNVALVDGRPQVLGLRELLQVYVDHRIDVVRRRSSYRRRKREERLHLVDGLVIALLNIDEVIQVIRSSDDAAAARERLQAVFDLSEIQAQYILDTPLRRLTRFDRIELERERETLQQEIAELTAILDSDERLRALVSDELKEIASRFGTPRRTVLLEDSGAARAAAGPLEVGDDPCTVLLSATGLLARTPALAERPGRGLPDGGDGTGDPGTHAGGDHGGGDHGGADGGADGGDPGSDDGGRRRDGGGPDGASRGPADGRWERSAHDAIASTAASTARGYAGLVTSAGRVIRLSVLEVPALPPTARPAGLAGGAPLSEFVSLRDGETAIGLCSLDPDGPPLTIGTAQGMVKRVVPEYPQARDDFEVISLRDGDRVAGAAQPASDDADLVFVTSDGQLLRFKAATVRPQGRAAGGMAGIRLAAGARVIWFGAVTPGRATGAGAPGAGPGGAADATGPVVVTVAGSAAELPGTGAGGVKVTPYAEFPAKGRGTGGVRCHRFLRGEDALLLAWAGDFPPLGATAAGTPVDLPGPFGRRDGSGVGLADPLAMIGATFTAEI